MWITPSIKAAVSSLFCFWDLLNSVEFFEVE